MTKNQSLEEAVASVLQALGTIKNSSSDSIKGALMVSIRKIMVDSYMQGSNDCHNSLKSSGMLK